MISKFSTPFYRKPQAGRQPQATRQIMLGGAVCLAFLTAFSVSSCVPTAGRNDSASSSSITATRKISLQEAPKEKVFSSLARPKSDHNEKPSEASDIWDKHLGEGLPVIRSSMSLDACIKKAMEVNQKRPASHFALAVAEAQYRQAQSAYWPHFDLQGAATLRSEDMNYIFPAQQFQLPETTVNVPPSTFTLPETTLPLPFGPVTVPSQNIPVPGQQFVVPSQTFNLPAQDIKVMDRKIAGAQVDMKWLLWSGGWREALNDQARAGINSAQQDSRRSDLEIIHDVKRMYYGAVLANELKGIGNDTLEGMEALLELTEQLYKGGSMQVSKTDYLRNKVLVESLRGIIAKLSENQRLAESALVHAMGLSWRSQVKPSQRGLSFRPLDQSVEKLVSRSYSFSPDWKQLQAGLSAAEAKLRESKAERMPKVAMIGKIHGAMTPYDQGHSTDQNLNAWTIGVGVEMPLFNGGLTKAKIDEAQARLSRMEKQKVLLAEGLALKVKSLVIKLDAMEKQDKSNRAARQAALENRELSEKAYRHDLIEADKVFQAQIMEAFQKAKYHKLRHDHLIVRSHLDLVVGSEMLTRLGLNG